MDVFLRIISDVLNVVRPTTAADANHSTGNDMNNSSGTNTRFGMIKNSRQTVAAGGAAAAGATVVAATTSRSTSIANAKLPRKHQKHRIDSRCGVNKRDSWPLTSSSNDRSEYSSNEDLATCSKGTFIDHSARPSVVLCLLRFDLPLCCPPLPTTHPAIQLRYRNFRSRFFLIIFISIEFFVDRRK